MAGFNTLITVNTLTLRDEVMNVWEKPSDEELVMLWLWHNAAVREIYRLAPKTITQASLLTGMGIAVISEARSDVCTTELLLTSRLQELLSNSNNQLGNLVRINKA